jgi:hypothetical protein
MGYWSRWNSTDQIPTRAIAIGLLPRYGLLDGTDGGKANRQSIAGELQRSEGPSALRATGFVLRSSLDLFSNFTYFLDDPVHGDQFEQTEQRLAIGGRLTYRRIGRFLQRHTESSTGVQLRSDRLLPVGLYRTAARHRLSTTREDRVGQTTVGVYAQSEIEWLPRLRTTFGLRGDVYGYSVESDNPLNSGRGADALVSPKVGVVLGPWNGTELYVNAGAGFHSNDARGATIAVDPETGEGTHPVTPLVRARGAEIGLRTVRVRGMQSTVTLWHLGLDSELLFVGDAGTTQAGRPSRRAGLEWTNYFRPTPWLTVDGDLAFSRARFTNADAAGHRIPGALDRVISAGVVLDPPVPLSGSLRARHFGPRALIEDGSVASKSTTLWNAELTWGLTDRARLVFEAFNIFDAAVSDIDYFYVSRLPGEPAEGVADIHTHPAIPRTARLALQVGF